MVRAKTEKNIIVNEEPALEWVLLFYGAMFLFALVTHLSLESPPMDGQV